jgi:hypothetical protein
VGVRFLLLGTEGRGFEARPVHGQLLGTSGASGATGYLEHTEKKGVARVRLVFPTLVVASRRPTGHRCWNTEPKPRGHR